MQKIGEKIVLKKENFNAYRDIDVSEALRVIQQPITIYWSWGTHGLTNMFNKALRIRVKGVKHKGHVYILVNSGDLFDVILTKVGGEIISITTDIFVENLQETIDHLVERDNEWSVKEYGEKLSKEKNKI